MKQAEFIWVLAHIQPATVNEILDAYPYDHGEDSVSGTALGCFREGLVQRRKRPVEGTGENPYEYALVPLPDT